MTVNTTRTNRRSSPRKTCAQRGNERGFSLLEMMVTVALILVVTGISFMSLQPALRQQHLTTAYNATLNTLRRARDQAAADMRVYVVTFTAPGTITVTQNSTTGPILITTLLPPDVTFNIVPGVPTSPTVAPTTPDGFGTAANPIDFDQGVGAGGAISLYFQPDGTAVDINGNINNGVVYMARPTELMSSRAITVWGTTGRIRGWTLVKNGAGVMWRQQ